MPTAVGGPLEIFVNFVHFINLENKPITSSLTLPASVGGSAGVYLPININGTIYKIQLFNS